MNRRLRPAGFNVRQRTDTGCLAEYFHVLVLKVARHEVHRPTGRALRHLRDAAAGVHQACGNDHCANPGCKRCRQRRRLQVKAPAGHFFIATDASMPMVAVWAILIKVGSGLTGKFLLERSKRRPEETRIEDARTRPEAGTVGRAHLMGQPELRRGQALAGRALPDHAGVCRAVHGTHRRHLAVLELVLTAWKPATFEHSKFFQLDEDHNATCITCHAVNDFSRFTCHGCHEHTPSNILRPT